MELPTGQDKKAELFRAVVALKSANGMAFNTVWGWFNDQLAERDKEFRRATQSDVLQRISAEALALEKIIAVDSYAQEALRRQGAI